ncbi:MAG: 3-deoxy-D-manno-octulosonic acid transferase [Bacteroidia bacterium]|nr:3-deoxy-D-manno-octulosonic acid transferase [Bacteroidia bacterium]
MTLLYLVAVKLYAFAIVIASLFNKKAAQWVSGRKNWKSKIASVLKPGEKRLLFHCASFGEFEQGKPVLEALKNHYPQHKIVLTFFSPSGYENKKNDPLADYVFYLPVDGPFNSKNFIELIQPEMAFFVKYDFWHYYIKTFKDKKIPVYFVSSIFRPTQIFFQWYGKFFDKMLRRVTHFFVQNQGSLELLYKNSIPQVTVTGDTRFDRVFEASQHPKPLPEIETFKGKHKLFVAGSTWGADEQLVAALIPDLESDYKIIVVPHEIKETKISKLKILLGNEAIRYTEWDKKQTSARILIIDNMGMLASIYQYADLVYIGGGFGKGIHNILEAAVYGTPIIFGPKYKKFREADELVHWKGAFSINNERGLRDKVFELIHEPGRIDKIKEINTRYINNNKGATNLIINYLKMNP